MWKAIFQNKLSIYRVNLPSYTHKIIKCRRYVVLRSQDWQKSTPKMAAWERLIPLPWLWRSFRSKSLHVAVIIITLVKIHAGLQAWIESYSNKWCICDMTSRWQKLRRKPKLPSTNRTARTTAWFDTTVIHVLFYKIYF